MKNKKQKSPAYSSQLLSLYKGFKIGIKDEVPALVLLGSTYFCHWCCRWPVVVEIKKQETKKSSGFYQVTVLLVFLILCAWFEAKNG